MSGVVVRLLPHHGCEMPRMVTAQWCRDLRYPDGAKPCEDGLRRALDVIGDRTEAPLIEVLSGVSEEDREWAEVAIGAGGNGDGNGNGYGYGDGYGYGNGYGYGDGDG